MKKKTKKTEQIIRAVSFPDTRFFEAVQDYSTERDVNFSRALLELAEAGLKVYKTFKTLNVEIVKAELDLERRENQWRKETAEMLKRIDRLEKAKK